MKRLFDTISLPRSLQLIPTWWNRAASRLWSKRCYDTNNRRKNSAGSERWGTRRGWGRASRPRHPLSHRRTAQGIPDYSPRHHQSHLLPRWRNQSKHPSNRRIVKPKPFIRWEITLLVYFNNILHMVSVIDRLKCCKADWFNCDQRKDNQRHNSPTLTLTPSPFSQSWHNLNNLKLVFCTSLLTYCFG